MTARFPAQKILVAVDASQPSWSALEAAKKVATLSGAEIEVLFIEEILPAVDFDPNQRTMERAQRDLKTEVERGAAAAMATFPGKWTLSEEVGHAPGALVQHAHPQACQLMIMGTHGRQGGERFLLGSTAEAVFHRAGIPVLAVRAGQEFDPSRILVPCNLKSYGDEALGYALDFGAPFKAEVTALFVPPAREWDLDADRDLKADIEAAFGVERAAGIKRLLRRGEPREQIALEAKEGRYGLVVLSGHHRDQLSDLALGTTAERLLRKIDVPMLVVPSRAKTQAA